MFWNDRLLSSSFVQVAVKPPRLRPLVRDGVLRRLPAGRAGPPAALQRLALPEQLHRWLQRHRRLAADGGEGHHRGRLHDRLRHRPGGKLPGHVCHHKVRPKEK